MTRGEFLRELQKVVDGKYKSVFGACHPDDLYFYVGIRETDGEGCYLEVVESVKDVFIASKRVTKSMNKKSKGEGYVANEEEFMEFSNSLLRKTMN